MELLNDAMELSGGTVMAFHGRAILRCAERRCRSVVVITAVDAVLVNEQSRQRSQMTCTR